MCWWWRRARLASQELKLVDQAQRCFRRCAAARPEDPGPLLQLAACRTHLGK